MAKIGPPNHGFYRRAPALKNRLIIRSNGRGRIIAQRWPRKRNRPIHPTTRAQADLFRQIVALSKRVHPEMYVGAISFTKRTALMPRDIIIKALYGNLLALHQYEGRTYVPMSTIQQISALLDLITNVPGSILVRGTDLWEEGAAAGGGAEYFSLKGHNELITATDFSANATQGFIFDNKDAADVSGAMLYLWPQNGYQYIARLMELDGSNEIQSIVSSNTISATEDDRRFYRFDLTAELKAGTRYALCQSRVDSTDTAEARMQRTDGYVPLFPAVGAGTFRQAKKLPAVGDTLSILNSDQCPQYALALTFT